mgnify:CR=1 FL=1
MKGTPGPQCIQTYYKCQDGRLQETDKHETGQFWKGEGNCDIYRPTFQPPSGSSTPSIIDITSPANFTKYSPMCQKNTMLPSPPLEDNKRNIIIFLLIIIFLSFSIVIFYTIKSYLPNKLVKNI